MSGSRLTIAVLAALAPAATLAAPAVAGQKTDVPTVSELLVMPPKMVSELSVVARKECLKSKPDRDAPEAKVVSTYPPNGAVVRPGLLLVRITFATPMTCAGFLVGDATLRDPCPDGRQDMLLSLDRKTLWTLCRTTPHERFGLWMNPMELGDDLPVALPRVFTSLAGRRLSPYHLTFETTDGPPVTTAEDAVAQDPETAARIKR